MALAKRYRLRSPQAFSKVYRLGRRVNGACIGTRALRIDLSSSQRNSDQGNSVSVGPCFGISISRKVSKKAVIRNRIKRQIKAGLQALLPRAHPGWYVVISVRSSAVKCQCDEFLRELEQQLLTLEVIDGCS